MKKIVRAGFLDNIRLRTFSMEQVQSSCLKIGLVCVSKNKYRLGELHKQSVSDIYYNLVFLKSGFWLIKVKNRADE